MAISHRDSGFSHVRDDLLTLSYNAGNRNEYYT